MAQLQVCVQEVSKFKNQENMSNIKRVKTFSGSYFTYQTTLTLF